MCTPRFVYLPRTEGASLTVHTTIRVPAQEGGCSTHRAHRFLYLPSREGAALTVHTMIRVPAQEGGRSTHHGSPSPGQPCEPGRTTVTSILQT